MNDVSDMSDDESDDVFSCVVGAEDSGERIDKVMASRLTDLSRSRLKALMLEGAVMVNDVPCDNPSLKVKEGMVIMVAVPPPVDDTPQPQDIPLDILFEDDDMLVINKPAGLVVHPGAGNHDGTLVNALLYHCGDSLSGIGGVRRPGIVHRLDKDTSGLMVAAKHDKAHKGLSSQLSDRTLGRHYQALVWGVPIITKGNVNQPIGRHAGNRLKMAINKKAGREARTYYEVREKYGDTACMMDCKLDSGRTHQVRVHMAFLKYPLIGDPLYGIQENAARSMLKKGGYEDVTEEIMSFPRQALHAWKISYIHPISGEVMSFEAPMPKDMADLENHLKSAP